jgi:hypothetical protein
MFYLAIMGSEPCVVDSSVTAEQARVFDGGTDTCSESSTGMNRHDPILEWRATTSCTC